ncbi:hypothetical protein KCU79_g177, partial [Aureobasidium melanogenum]
MTKPAHAGTIQPFHVIRVYYHAGMPCITAYVWNACALSLLGVVGICIRSPSLVTVFANHLLIDAFVSLIPKLGLTLIVNRHTATYPGAAATDRYQVMTWKSTLVAQLFKDCQSVVVV